MHLSKHNAEMIVKEINIIIDRKINMMNEKGVIIASTDLERIGQVHEGARKIIEEHLDELLIQSQDDYGGSLEGVNYPITISGEIIGVVGITGPCCEVAKYGQITKKMTEILMQEISIKEQKSMDESLRSRFIGEWLQNENVIINKNFVERGKRMNLDITVPRRILIISMSGEDAHSDSLDELRRVESAEKKVKNMVKRLDADSIYMKSASNLVFGVTTRTDRDMRRLAEAIRGIVEEQTNLKAAIGIDDQCHPYTVMHISYSRAYKALQSCLRIRKSDIRFYNDINMEIFTDEISDLSKIEYVQKLFAGYEAEELPETIGLLETLYETEGSITTASEQLHMHKNTLQYKLKRIYDRTGYDPRSLRYAALFYIAIDFYREIRDLLEGE
ncbi:MAG: sugar diacid recognition domain-containing protein [Eubacteriales bacterium]|nr:sugar diacid recognition domain-containing protein [Eubacteriales bacterium]